jgi:hypothetical protein
MAGQARQKATLPEVVRTVLSGFLGVRRRADHEEDTRHISPVHIIVVAVVLVAIFIVTLITIAHLVTSR